MRKHGIDFGLWRQWAEPDNPPIPLDFVVAGITYGAYPNQMWEANRDALLAYAERGNLLCYHFYQPVSALSQIKAFVPRAAEVGAFAVVVDWEDTKSHTLNANDVPVLKDIIQQLWQAWPKDKVLVYSNHKNWMTIIDTDPDFANEVELWLAWPNGNPDTDYYHALYADRMGRPFDEVRLFQYSWTGNAQAYGVLNSPTEIDLDVYTHKQPFDEWVGNEEEPEEEMPDVIVLTDQVKRIADALERIADKLDTEVVVENKPNTIGKTVYRDGKNVYLFCVQKYNAKGAPVFIIYPQNVGDFNESVYVPSGTTVQVFPDKVVGDGGNIAYKVDKSQLTANLGAAIPDAELYVMDKFVN